MSAIAGMALNLAGNAANQAISQWINYGFQKKLMGKQYEYNEKAAENAYQRQLDFWDMQNKYDDPASQILRLREAGLNPGMINGQLGGQSNNLSSVSSSNVGTPPGGPAPGKFDVMQIMMQDEQMKNLAADTAVKREDAENKRLLNIQEAIRANDFETYYQLTKDKLTGEKKLNEAQEQYYREQANKTFQEARSAAVAANNAEGAAAEGINPIVDDHNVKDAQATLFKANAAKLANDIKNDNQRVLNETSLASVMRELHIAQKNNYDAETLLKNLAAPKAEADAFMISKFGVDPSSLPTEVRSVAYAMPIIADLFAEGKISREEYDKFVEDLGKTLQFVSDNYINSNNPDHITPKDKVAEQYRKQEYWLQLYDRVMQFLSFALDNSDTARQILLY